MTRVELERIVSSTRINLPISLMYEAIRNAYAKVDPAQATEAAFSATFAFYPLNFMFCSCAARSR